VIFTFSRLALALLALAVVAVIAVLVLSRERRLLLALGGCVLAVAAGVVLAVGLGKFPLFRYEPIQDYDANGRFIAWVFGADMVREAPLGTGSGSFERRTAEYSEALVKRDTLIEDGTAVSDNLIRNGALDSLNGWTFDPTVLNAEAVSDPTSITGHAIRKRPTEQYRDVAQIVRIVPGRTYSLGAQVRSDGTPTLVIVHWYDDAGTRLSQTGTEPTTSTTWTEAVLLDQRAPSQATQAVLFLSNRTAGEQYFTAVRMVEGPALPSWSTSEQWGAGRNAPPGLISAHNTYIRIAVESGLPGLVVFAAYWFLLLRRARKPGAGAWEWLVASCLVLLAGFVIDTLHWRVLWIYAAVLAASFADARVPQETAAAAPAPDLTVRPGASLGKIFIEQK